MSKKYEYSANDFTLTDSAINVRVCVAPSNFNLLPIFTLSVPVEKKDGEDISYYRGEAIKKAKEVIADIAEDAVLSEPHQNVLQERAIAHDSDYISSLGRHMDLTNIMIVTISDKGISLTFNGGMASYDKEGHLESYIGYEPAIPTYIKLTDKRSDPK